MMIIENTLEASYIKRKYIYRAIICILIVIFPLIGVNDYILRIAVSSSIYILLAASLNLISGVAGQISIGHAAFYGIGAYSSALLALKLNFPFILCFLCSALITAIVSVIIGITSLRLSGGYLGIVTVGFAEIVRLILINWQGLTRGPMGLMDIPQPILFGYKFTAGVPYYYLSVTVCAVGLVIINNLINSKFGRNLKAINDDELAAESMGINSYKSKIFAFTIAGAIAALAGSLFAHYMRYIDPSSFKSEESSAILSIVVLGGMGNLKGTVLVAILLTALPEVLRGFSQFRMMIYGALLIVFMLLQTIDYENVKTRIEKTLHS